MSRILTAVIALFAALVLSTSAGASPKAVAEAQVLAKSALAEVQANRKPYFVAAYSHGDRDITYCSENCVCMANAFSPIFKSHGFDVRTIVLHPSQKSFGIKIRGAPVGFAGPAIYDFHAVTAIRAGNRWWILDPIILPGAQLEPLWQWKTRLQSPVSWEIRR